MTKIEWTDATWNPVGGCSIKSPGCVPCYAQRLAGTRLKHHPLYAATTTVVKGKPLFNGKLTALPPNHPNWSWPLRWRGATEPLLGPGMPSLIFVGDMSDLLHEDRSLGYFMRVLDIGSRSKHILQILTKRADRLAQAVTMWMDTEGEDFDFDFKDARGPDEVRAKHPSGRGKLFADMLDTMGEPPPGCAFPSFDWLNGHLRWPDVLPRIWLGFSAERQREFDERWSHMRALAERGWTIYVSYEPAIGPLILPPNFLALGSRVQVIAGGMSGSEATPAHPDWFRRVRDDCTAAGVRFFFKQWGGWAPVCALDDEALDKLYKTASVRDPEATRQCRAPKIVMHADGTYFTDVAAPMAFAGGSGAMLMFDIGKKAAGRLLDGKEHNGFPQWQSGAL